MHTSLFRSIPRSRIDLILLQKINWLPVFEREESRIATTVFKYWNGNV